MSRTFKPYRPTLRSKSMRPITTCWRTGEGTRIRICDMDDNHLLNAVRYVERKLNKRYSHPHWSDAETTELLGEWDVMVRVGADITLLYYDMVEEAGRRGLAVDVIPRTITRDKGKLHIDFSLGPPATANGRGPDETPTEK